MPNEKSGLLRYFNRLVKYFIPYQTDEDDWESRKYRIIAGICVTTCLYAAMYYPLMFIEHYVAPVYTIPFTASGCIAILFMLRRRVPVNAAIHSFIWLIIVSETAIIIFSGGVYNNIADTQFLEIPVLVALLLLNARWTFTYLGISIGLIVLLAVLQSHGIPFEPLIDPAYAHLHITMAVAGHLIVAYMVVNLFQQQRKAAFQRLAEKQKIVEEERERSDHLLRNILPEETMQELKASGKTTARSYALVTVLFADFKDFTKLSEEMTAEELVQGIDEYFEAFDRIVAKYDVEKIKTVGDAYICASGLPEANKNNPCIIVGVGLEMLAAVHEISERRRNLGLHTFEVRIGVHSGPLVAGVVGIKKFAYDIWGDTVNTAARMQQSGEPGRMNISGATYELVSKDYKCAYRGKIEAKNKGAVDMYFVEGETGPVDVLII